MLEFKALTAAIAAIVLSLSTGASFAQYKGPPIIIQTPSPPPSTMLTTSILTLPSTTLPTVSAPAAAARAAPAQAVPARR